jgi:hypothetical protein
MRAVGGVRDTFVNVVTSPDPSQPEFRVDGRVSSSAK